MQMAPLQVRGAGCNHNWQLEKISVLLCWSTFVQAALQRLGLAEGRSQEFLRCCFRGSGFSRSTSASASVSASASGSGLWQRQSPHSLLSLAPCCQQCWFCPWLSIRGLASSTSSEGEAANAQPLALSRSTHHRHTRPCSSHWRRWLLCPLACSTQEEQQHILQSGGRVQSCWGK